MTQEEKELVLKDLCTRLPYMPKIKIIYQQQGIKGTDEGNVSCDFIEKIVNDLRNDVITDMQIYLRPMSSMTKEEDREWQLYKNNIACACDENLNERISELYDWFNEHHFDYCGLIEKGLALEAPEE